MNNHRRTWLGVTVGLALAVAAVAVVAAVLLFDRDTSSSAPAANAVQPVQVEATKVVQTSLHPSLDLVGQIAAIPEHTAVVSSQAGGWISSVDVVEGQAVHAGDTLLTLDSRRADSNLLRAKAVLAQAQATLAKLQQGYLPEEITAAEQACKLAKANVDSLQTEVSALDDLLKRDEISRVQYETKQKELEAAQATLASAVANLKLRQRGTRPEAIAEAQAQVDVAAADVQASQLAVDWCTICSPIDGVVVQLAARRGQFFDQAIPLATITDLSEVFAQLRIPSDAVAKVEVGAPVDVLVPAFPDDVFHGAVSRRSGEADPLSGDLNMFVTLKNPDRRLRPGFSCRAQVWLPPINDALVVPVSAIADHDGRTVVTAVRDGKANEVAVTTGAQADGLVQLLGGLAVGDVVATKGGYGLPNGYPVAAVLHNGDSTGSD